MAGWRGWPTVSRARAWCGACAVSGQDRLCVSRPGRAADGDGRAVVRSFPVFAEAFDEALGVGWASAVAAASGGVGW